MGPLDTAMGLDKVRKGLTITAAVVVRDKKQKRERTQRRASSAAGLVRGGTQSKYWRLWCFLTHLVIGHMGAIILEC